MSEQIPTTPSTNPYQFQEAEEAAADRVAENANRSRSPNALLFFGIMLLGGALAITAYANMFPQLATATAPPQIVQLVVVCLYIGAFSLLIFGSIAMMAFFSYRKFLKKKLGTREK